MLLVGGDSFAQFPKTEWVMETNSSRPCSQWDGKNIHWCELLSQELNIDCISTGVAGGDSSITSYETIREIYNNKSLTHCIFFITSPWRTAIRNKPSVNEREFKNRMIHYDNRSVLSLREYYSSELKDVINLPGSHYTTLESDCKLEIDLDHLWHRVDRVPEHEFIQKQLNSLTTISTMAKSRGIKLLFASGFPENISSTWVKEELGDLYFQASNIMSQPELRSHYNLEEHKSLLTKFKTEMSKTIWTN